jgi:hypothetical protein
MLSAGLNFGPRRCSITRPLLEVEMYFTYVVRVPLACIP